MRGQVRLPVCGASLLTAALIAAVATVYLQAFGPQATIGDSLDLYDASEYERALGSIRTSADVDAVCNGLVTGGAAWVETGHGLAGISRRRLVAATFALDVAGVSITDSTVDGARAQADRRARLIAWGGAVLTTARAGTTLGSDDRAAQVSLGTTPAPNLPVQPFERLWFRSAAALIENMGWVGLIDLPAKAFVRVSPTYPLVPLALLRTPNDLNVLLARAAAEERAALSPVPAPTGSDPDSRFPGPDSTGSSLHGVTDLDRVSQLRTLLQHATLHFKALTTSAAVGAEANLRLGYIELAGGRPSVARDLFRNADALPGDPYTRYLSRLFTGMAWERDGRAPAAEAAYRAALDVVPRARSASTLLASLLFLDDRRQESTAVLESGLAARPPETDPWRTFVKGVAGDGRRWPDMLAELRAQLR
jgi:hypothetical protein